MACRSGKIAHTSREAALGHVRELEYINSRRGRDVDSVGLAAYPCNGCHYWHVGHRHIPTVWHYDTVARLDEMLEADALVPPKPKRLCKSQRRQLSGRSLALSLKDEEPEPLSWFTWNAAWHRHAFPHPGVFLDAFLGNTNEGIVDHTPAGIVRLGVPASVVTLRWRDYEQRNGRSHHVVSLLAKHIASRVDWLATDQNVPFRLVRSIEVWYRGAWVSVESVTDADYDAYRPTSRGHLQG